MGVARTAVLWVAGLWGSEEARALQRALLRLQGVESANVDIADGLVIVCYDASTHAEKLVRRLKEQGWQVLGLARRPTPFQCVLPFLLAPVNLSIRFFGPRAWEAWERLVTLGTWMFVTLARPYLRRRCPRKDGLRGLACLVDLADGLIGVEGEWVEQGPERMVKHVYYCPCALLLQQMPDFCTRLGLKMGEAAFQAYAPGLPVRYAITRTISRGDPYCEYILAMRNQ